MHCQHMKRCKCEVVSCGRRIERSVNIKKDVPYVPKRMRYFFSLIGHCTSHWLSAYVHSTHACRCWKLRVHIPFIHDQKNVTIIIIPFVVFTLLAGRSAKINNAIRHRNALIKYTLSMRPLLPL